MLAELVADIPLIPRNFLVMRIAGLSKAAAMEITGMTRGSYDRWVCKPEFKKIYRKLDEYTVTYRMEAITFLRRSNQLSAVEMESMIIAICRRELEDGSYIKTGSMVRSNIGNDVYKRLMPELDKAPDKQLNVGAWEQNFLALLQPKQGLLNETNPIIEADECTEAEYTEGAPRKKNKQTNI